MSIMNRAGERDLKEMGNIHNTKWKSSLWNITDSISFLSLYVYLVFPTMYR